MIVLAFYPTEFKEYLVSVTSIENLINSLTNSVQKRGNHYVALCPFHDDNNPSLFIDSINKTWSCQSCGAGSLNHQVAKSSDIFGFVKAFMNINFPAAVEYIAKFNNVSLPNVNPAEILNKQKDSWWFSITAEANQRFQANLLAEKNLKTKMYLNQRGITDTMIAAFNLGLGDDLTPEFVHTKGRITFPIYDLEDNIVSFSARVPLTKSEIDLINQKNKETKSANYVPIQKYLHRYPLSTKYDPRVTQDYVNNHPYPTFEKRNFLYGLQYAASYIRKYKKAILVEGFTDVIRLHEHGINHSVSTMGTSLTKEQCAILKRLGIKTVVLMRDGDLAGINAMERDAKILEQEGILYEVTPLPLGDDPDSLADRFSVLKDDYARFIALNTKKLSEWRVERAFKDAESNLMHHYHEINNLLDIRVEAVAKAIAEEPDSNMKEFLKHQYANLLCTSVENLETTILKYTQLSYN